MQLETLVHLEFEVFGKVQGVYFRKHTQAKAESLGVRGWIMNTKQKTVKGEIEGKPASVKKMKNWLTKEGSPKSRIDKTTFGTERTITTSSYDEFSIVK